MSNLSIQGLMSQILGQNAVSEPDFLALRRAVYGDNHVSLIEADMLFRINDQVTDRPENWSEFFVNAITNFLIHQTMPKGYVDAANAAWLMERIDHDGVTETETEFALLMNVVKLALSIPERLELYVLNQVRSAIVEGNGFLGRLRDRKGLQKHDVDVLRDALYACGGQNGFGISRQEAEFLFELNDAVIHAENHESWDVLFIGGITNHLMMLQSPGLASAKDAARGEQWLYGTTGSGTPDLATSRERLREEMNEREWIRKSGKIVWNFKNAKTALKVLLDDGAKASFVTNSTATLEAEKIDEVEARWLSERLFRDGMLSPNETKLLEFLKEECGNIHHSLAQIMDRAA